MLENYPRHGPAADGEDSMSEWLRFLQFSTSRITFKRLPRTKNRINATQSDDLRTHLQEGVIHRDKSNNVTR